MKASLRFVWSCLLLSLAGCATPSREQPTPGLGNTQWVLIGYHEGTIEAELHEVPLYTYTLRLDASGEAGFKFDCNQGSSTWRAMPAAGGKGTLSFGVVAVTAALCDAGSIGETLSSDIGRVTRYSIYDGRLTMHPDGNGRIYVWDSVD